MKLTKLQDKWAAVGWTEWMVFYPEHGHCRDYVVI